MKKAHLPSLLLTLACTFLFSSCQALSNPSKQEFETGENIHVEGYTLRQAVVLSRHSIRAPLSAPGSLLERMTPHQWCSWSSDASELSIRGGVLETEMGLYFRKWLEYESLFPKNFHPEEDEVRIYANAKQRTIATAEYFVSGLLPSANKEIEINAPYDTMDPVFNPQLTFVSDSYVDAAKREIDALFGSEIKELEDEYALLEEVLDLTESKAYKDGELEGFSTDDTEISLKFNAEPSMTGSLKTACSASDALTLQYYEEEDPKKAGFGHELSFEQWQGISRIKDVYGRVLFSSPLVSYNVAHPLLETIEGELNGGNRKFSFLCGHDSNLSSVLSALEVEEYELPGSIEADTPIGSKLVFSSFLGKDEEEYLRADLVYQNVDFLKTAPLLDLENHPSVVPLSFKGLEENKDGLYKKADFLSHLHEATSKYDDIVNAYSY